MIEDSKPKSKKLKMEPDQKQIAQLHADQSGSLDYESSKFEIERKINFQFLLFYSDIITLSSDEEEIKKTKKKKRIIISDDEDGPNVRSFLDEEAKCDEPVSSDEESDGSIADFIDDSEQNEIKPNFNIQMTQVSYDALNIFQINYSRV